MITIKKREEEYTFYVGKNVYDNNNVNTKKQDKVGFKDMLIMTLAIYRIILPILFGAVGFFILLFILVF